jgi:hypothetical protein
MRTLTGTYQHQLGTIAAEFSDDDEMRLEELRLDGRDLSDEAFEALCAAEGATTRLVLDALRFAAIDAAEWPSDAEPIEARLDDVDLALLAEIDGLRVAVG